MNFLPWLIVLVSLSAFFSAVEIAIFSLPESKLRSLLHKRNGRISKQAHRIERLRRNPQRLLATLVVGDTLVDIAAASMATAVAIDTFGSLGIGIATGIMTVIILIVGEILPKTIAQQNPVLVARLASGITLVLVYAMTPLSIFFELLSKATAHIMGASEQAKGVSEEEVRAMLHMGTESGNVAMYERDMIENIFTLDDITAEHIMTQVSDVVALNVQQDPQELLQIMLATGFSRFPAHSGNINSITGILYTKDVLAALAKHGRSNLKVKELVVPAMFVPEQKRLDDLLRDFQHDKRHIAIVVNEFGETRGLVTLEDILEEIVGDIKDEQDHGQPAIKRINAKTVVAAADATVGDLQRVLRTKFYDDIHRSIAWVILEELRRVPEKGEELTLNAVKIIIEEAEDRKIKRVKLIKIH